MHLCTTIKVNAKNSTEAIEKVNREIMRDDISPFDYVADGQTCTSRETMNETEFKNLRTQELETYKQQLEKALAMSDTEYMKGYYLRMAGENLEADMLWSTERQAYDLTEKDSTELVWYIDIDRHF